MYFPYLRAKLFELKALKEFFQEHSDEQRIIPVLEPVNDSYSALQSALIYFIELRKQFALVMNPELGDFGHASVAFKFPTEHPEIVHNSDCIPAFIVDENSVGIIDKLADYPERSVMLIFQKGADIGKEVVKNLVDSPKTKIILCPFDKSPRRTKSYLLGLGKTIVTFEDRFKEQRRNADYLKDEDESFSEAFKYYAEDNYQGFADYTALPSSFTGEGMLPYALAIHLTYLLSEDQIYIHHFVSDSNRDQSNIRGKFFEAASKVVAFYANGRYKTPSVEEIIRRAGSETGFPGLGYLKKLSIKNHLELIHHLLG